MQIRAGQPLPEVTYDFDLNGGNVSDYPLDRYMALITFAASERTQDGSEKSLPNSCHGLGGHPWLQHQGPVGRHATA